MMGCVSRESKSPKYQSHACKWGRWRSYSPLIGFIGTFINRIIKDKTKISFSFRIMVLPATRMR